MSSTSQSDESGLSEDERELQKLVEEADDEFPSTDETESTSVSDGLDTIPEDGLEWLFSTTLGEVRQTVTEEFDESQWLLTEAILSTHATLLLSDRVACTGLIVVGDSGAGKTTALNFFNGLDEQCYRSDDATYASFVTADPSLSEDEREEADLLPRTRHKSFLCSDMATWFSGQTETIRRKMSLMTRVMDGEGFTRDTGTTGQRGYQGDYRFNFIGASTPLQPRAWRVMGHAGYRFVFYHKPQGHDRNLKDDLFGESHYHERVAACQEIVHEYLEELWKEYDGYGGATEDTTFTDDAKDAIEYLARVIKFSRATLDGTKDEPTVNREDPRRVGGILRDIARGRALLDRETTVRTEHIEVSARIALSTMHKERRPIVRALLDPANDGTLATSDVVEAGPSRPTALNRMELLDTLGLADFVEDEDDDRQPKRLELNSKFEWPDCLEFSEF